MTHFEFTVYSIDNLIRILIEKTETDEATINAKLHTIYFKSYFKALDAKVIIVENYYIDRDFLEDYAGYYVSCYKTYKKKCTRLHFFNMEFTEDDYNNFIEGETSAVSGKKLQDSYLGFIVLKPLPKTIIGKTCLITYDKDNGRRNFPIVRKYEVNLFGINLTVKSLAFQEQDHVVSACATSSLWSVFHGSGILFQHPIPSPVDITKTACDHSMLETRYFPNNGLTLPQMAHAIKDVGLEPFLIRGTNIEVLQSTLYAYLSGGVPLLLGLFLVDMSAPGDVGLLKGKHAVAITGYSIDSSHPKPFELSPILLRGTRIDKIYAHDDQVGPFARMVFDDREIEYLAGNQKRGPFRSLHTSWVGSDGKIGSIRAIPDMLLIPLYHKIRIPFETIFDLIITFDSFIEKMRVKGILNIKQRLEWDIFLTTTNQFKTALQIQEYEGAKLLSKKIRRRILLENKPRFIWRAIAIVDELEVMELLFDATDIEQGLFLHRVIGYDQKLFDEFIEVSRDSTLMSAIKEKPIWKILKWFSETKKV